MSSIFFKTDQAFQMGEFISAIVRQNLAWNCKEEPAGWIITITGY